MWLLNTKTIELKYFNGPNDKGLIDDGGYAILSHMWQGVEQSFQDVLAFQSPTSISPYDTPHFRASSKIRNCCQLAESHGHHWVWVDTCCIDKTSSAELSEAINSMYEWYAQATVCYAYLGDVSSDDIGSGSSLYKSRWWKRGWTLQELIAPPSLLFVLANWTVLGTRTDLADDVSNITKIDREVLHRRRELQAVSIAERMSWASERQTTRIEDEAYCLMGIFGINMPTVYGEGRAAFYRLQEEIMKISPDQTIFAWGDHIPFVQLSSTTFQKQPRISQHQQWEGFSLFAASPHDFHKNPLSNYRAEPIAVADAVSKLMDEGWSLKVEAQTAPPGGKDNLDNKPRASEFTVSSHGMRSTLPIIWMGDQRFCIAVLGCRDAVNGAVIGILLCSRLNQNSGYRGDYEVYSSNVPLESGGISPGRPTRRLVTLSVPDGVGVPDGGSDSVPRGPYGVVTWDTIYIMHRPPTLRHNRAAEALPATGIQFSQWSIVELEKLGFQCEKKDRESRGLWRQYRLHTFTSKAAQEEDFTVVIGDCFCESNSRPNEIMVIVVFNRSGSVSGFSGSCEHEASLVEAAMTCKHCCRLGHAKGGQSWTQEFGDEDRAITLTFSLHYQDHRPCLVDIKISGKVYMSLCGRSPPALVNHPSTNELPHPGQGDGILPRPNHRRASSWGVAPMAPGLHARKSAGPGQKKLDQAGSRQAGWIGLRILASVNASGRRDLGPASAEPRGFEGASRSQWVGSVRK